MNQVDYKELSQLIKAYISMPKVNCPMVIVGKSGSGRSAILRRELKFIGQKSITLSGILNGADDEDRFFPYARCENERDWNIQSALARNWTKETGRQCFLIVDEGLVRHINEDLYQPYIVNYVFGLYDFLSWGHQTINLGSGCSTRLNENLMMFVLANQHLYNVDSGLTPAQLHLISRRWNLIERIPWMKNLDNETRANLYAAAASEFESEGRCLCLPIFKYIIEQS